MKIATCLLCLALLAPLAIAQPQAERLNIVHFTVEARAEIVNDEVLVRLEVEKSGTRPAELAKQVNADMNWALAKARQVAGVAAATQAYRTEPRYDRDGMIVSWRALQALTLSGSDVDAVIELATTLQERVPIKNMVFMPSHATLTRTEEALTREALKNFRERAELIRDSMAAEAYDLVQVNLQNNRPHQPMLAARMMALESASIGAEAGTSDLVVTASGQIRLR